MTQRTSRADRLTMPLARDAIRILAEARGGCIRPIQLRRTNLDTGQVDQQVIPCGPPSKPPARPAPNEAGTCALSNAATAGTSRTNPNRNRPTPTSRRSTGSPCAPKRRSAATRPKHAATTRPGSMS